LNTLVTPRGGPEFLSSTPNWENHTTINMENGQGRQLSDWESQPVALRVLHMPDSQACFFEHFNFNGRYKCFGTGDIGWVGEFESGHTANDSFSSFVIGKNCRVTLFEHGDHDGAETTLNLNQDTTQTSTQLMPSEGWSWNDKISSLKIACK
jgi:Beta/Gamma crystallin